MPEYSPPSKHPLHEWIKEQEEEFWKNHTVVDTAYFIMQSSYQDFDPEWGESTIPGKELWGPYRDVERVKKDLETIKANRGRYEKGDLYIQCRHLVETTVVKRFWINSEKVND